MEPFKNIFSPEMVDDLAHHLSRVSTGFDADLFKQLALKDLESLELKQRSEQFSHAIEAAMQGKFEDFVQAMIVALHPDITAEISDMRTSDAGLAGWALMPMTAYIARNGLDKPAFSLAALRHMTMRSSSEFDVRPFLRDHPEIAIEIMTGWTRDANVHVRRLASEGARPRLPWGIRLQNLVVDPSPILPILTALRDDESEYVRRSVANNLNDIAKDHPELVAGIAADWLKKATPEREKLVRHACRTLIKQGHSGVLKSFGFGPVQLKSASLQLTPENAAMGDDLMLNLSLTSDAAQTQNLLVDYVMYYRRANGGEGPKVFKWTQAKLVKGAVLTLTKTHKLREVTTRRHYAGPHRIEVQVNGTLVAEAGFELTL